MSDKGDVSEDELRWALDNELFQPLYQPIVRLSDRRPVGIEALVRLNHPDHGAIQPDRFVPGIEDAGLSLPLADQVTTQALQAFPPGFLSRNALSVAINLPLDVLLRQDALEQLDAVRDRYGVPCECVAIELTESQPAEDLDALREAIERWRRAGYALSLDDIGPDTLHGRELLTLPFTVVKLDKDAVRAWLEDRDCDRFVPSVIEAAKANGLLVIAEGVESAEDWTRIGDLGADQVQGFYVAKPLPAAELPAWLLAWRRAGTAEPPGNY